MRDAAGLCITDIHTQQPWHKERHISYKIIHQPDFPKIKIGKQYYIPE